MRISALLGVLIAGRLTGPCALTSLGSPPSTSATPAAVTRASGPPGPLQVLDCEAAALEDAGRMADGLAKREQALASVRGSEPIGSLGLLAREITTAAMLSNRHGQPAEAAQRLAAALTAFEAAAGGAASTDLAIQLEEGYHQLARIAARAHDPDGVRRAAEAAARYHAQTKQVTDMVSKADPSGAMRAMIQLQGLQEQIDRGDRDGARRELEHADPIDVLRLLMLADLESDAGDPDAALAALIDAAEGAEHDVELLQGIGAGAATTAPAMLPPLIVNLGLIEAWAYRAARQAGAPAGAMDRARALGFWLSELRKGRFFDALTFGERAGTPDGARALDALLRARAASAARYLARAGERPTPSTIEDELHACSEPRSAPRVDPEREREREQISKLEQQLVARASIGFPKLYMAGGTARARYPHGTADRFASAVGKAVPADSRFVGFSRVLDPGPGALMVASAELPSLAAAHYVAAVVGPAGVALIELGAAAEIDPLVAQAIAQVSSHPASEAAPPDAALLAAVQAVHDRIWRPLAPALGDAKHVYIGGDGALEALPFAALHDGTGWLSERYTLSYLHSARDLLAPKAPEMRAADPAVLADPIAPPAPSPTSPLQPGLFPKLRYAATEAEEVHKLLPHSLLLIGAQANEVTLLRAKHPQILHIASHAAFLSDAPRPRAASLAAQRGAAIMPAPALALPRSALPDDGEEGWMRSALVLGAPPPEARSQRGLEGTWDGFVTAYEIMAMDLRGTELVTLSACQTASGTVLGRHGTTNLQRAFLNAGAQSVLATLWKIDDRATPEWIRAFYAGLVAGHPRERAVQEAMAAVRSRAPHPYYWAAFSLAGATGPVHLRK